MSHTSTTRNRWAEELESRARAHWTQARTDELLQGKKVLIRPGDAAPLLRALGLLNADASLPPAQVRKYFQINHMVGVLGPAFAELRSRHERIRLLDAGCGRSYLTLLLAWCGEHVWRHRIEVLGVDRNADVIDECRRRTEIAALAHVARFEVGDLAAIPAVATDAIHGVIALHACDSATCDAIALGVSRKAELVAVAPCCQAELARGWEALADRGTVADDGNAGLAPIWRTPHLRRETAAHVTDAMRMLLLRAAGYEVAAIEFIGAEHTKKNTLIRAMRRIDGDDAARREYEALVRATGGIGLRLRDRLWA
ncbi:MAG TPA: SAM-dependent methyltransferase [Kofleriaceae bacterium]|nr:SAM-dependent methyltransferase [Kofleriaceae bacterium]